jgi:YHS domain-containing protein
VRVRVDGKTPRSVHQGKTYYFCADACRVKFERDPGKYVALEKE